MGHQVFSGEQFIRQSYCVHLLRERHTLWITAFLAM
jgi:hypothetical protein